jgi:hypothetical protein
MCISLYLTFRDRILKKYQLVKPFKITIPTIEDWQMSDNVTDPNVDHWFTDGLGINDCFGAGIFGPLYNYRESVPMGSLFMMFSAKVMAILKCTELLLTKNLVRRRIHICCDSRVAIAALVKTTAESSIVWECMQVLGKLNKLYKVTLGWIPRYQGISVNEEAD